MNVITLYLLYFFLSIEYSSVMVNKQRRNRNKSVTPLPILVPISDTDRRLLKQSGKDPMHFEPAAGHVIWLRGRALHSEPVKRFAAADELRPRSAKQFEAIAKLYALASGKKIDYDILKEKFRSLVEDSYGQPITDSVSKQADENPKQWSRQWLPAIFNRETEAARVVMWWPPRESVFVPAIYCIDHTTAHFVNLLMGKLFSGARPCLGCGVMFTPSRGNKLYHDYACAARQRMRRSRRRKERK